MGNTETLCRLSEHYGHGGHIEIDFLNCLSDQTAILCGTLNGNVIASKMTTMMAILKNDFNSFL